MQKNKNSIFSFAMQAGFGLGGFWVFKYLFIMGAVKYPALGFVNGFLIFLTPLLLLFYTVNYKNSKSDNTLKYWEGVKFGVILFFFASIIESVIVLLHVVKIDPAYISKANQELIDTTQLLVQSYNFDSSIVDEIKKQTSLSPAIYVFRWIMNNVFLGFILSLIISPIASRITILIKKTDK